MSKSAQIWITDKNGGKHFNTVCSEVYLAPERRNLERHIAQAAKYPAQYKFLDLATARIVTDADCAMSDDELLAALGV